MTETTHEALVRQTGAAEALLAYFQGQRDGLQADIGMAQAAYAALGADLKGVVNEQMYFTAHWRPSQPETGGNGGDFQTLQALINASPVGSHVLVRMYNDEIYDFTESVSIIRRGVRLYGMNGNDEILRPVLNCPIQETATHSSVAGQILLWNSSLRFERINLVFGAKPALGWSNQKSLVSIAATESGFADVSCMRVKVTGDGGVGIIRAHVGGIIAFSSYLMELDGPIFAVPDAHQGVSIFSSYNVTLTNGALLDNGGTLGTNMLKG